MNPGQEKDDEATSSTTVLLTGLMIFLVTLVAIALFAWLAGDSLLPEKYEGFD